MSPNLAVNVIAILLMLAGAVMLIAGTGGALAFALVAVGIALVVLLEAKDRRG